jgi:hypothetical protein
VNRISYITSKKFFGILQLFTEHPTLEYVTVLDSEVSALSPTRLNSLAVKPITKLYYSKRAYQDRYAFFQIQSLQSANITQNDIPEFGNSYSWYDNICRYERESFFQFLKDTFGVTAIPTSHVFNEIVRKLKDYSFDYLMYSAFLVQRKFVSIQCLDTVYARVFGEESPGLPITESLNLPYERHGIHRLAEFLNAYEVPWIPHLQFTPIDQDTLVSTCPNLALMFHLDRRP